MSRQLLPDLASLTPGPELAALLDALTLTEVPDEQIVAGAAGDLATDLAPARPLLGDHGRDQPPRTRPTPAPPTGAAGWDALDSWHWATHQIGAALTFTGRRADTEYGLARQLLRRPAPGRQALSDGQIDPPKAKVFAGYLINLTAAQIELISRRVLPDAPRWTTGQLAHRLLREVLAIDPAYTRRRYEKARARTRGVGVI